MAKKLVGDELLQYLREHEGEPIRDIIRDTGYVNSKGGLYKTKFYMAMSAAQGIQLGPEIPMGTRGPKATYRLKVGVNGQVPIGLSYTKEMGWEPGTYVTLEKDGEALVLVADTADDAAPSACGLTAA